MTDGSVSSDSWYQFTCTNQDGVALVNIGTNKTNFTVKVYNSSNIQLTPVAGSINYHSLFFENLVVGETYYILIQGTEPPPPATGGTSSGCKIKSFKICVTSPVPYQVQKRIKPSIASINTSCVIKYKGVAKNNCKAKNYKYGEFAYTESFETYPCNEEIWEDLAGTAYSPLMNIEFETLQESSILADFKDLIISSNGDVFAKATLINN